jgi:hypothetical protein
MVVELSRAEVGVLVAFSEVGDRQVFRSTRAPLRYLLATRL